MMQMMQMELRQVMLLWKLFIQMTLVIIYLNLLWNYPGTAGNNAYYAGN